MVKESSVNRRILRGVLSGTGLTAVTVVTAFIQIRLILGFLPKDMAGVWFLFLTIGAYIAYLDLGFNPTLSREIGFILGHTSLTDAERTEEIVDLIATCNRIFQGLAALAFAAGLIGGWFFLKKVAPGGHLAEIVTAWLIFTLGASVNVLGGGAFAALYGMGNVATERIIRAIAQFFGLFLFIIALYKGYGIVGLAAAWTIRSVVIRFYGWRALYRLNPHLSDFKGRATIGKAKKILEPSLKWAFISLCALMILQTDNLIIAALHGAAEVPAYEAASKIIINLMSFSLLIVTSSTPFLSKAFGAGNLDEFRKLLYRNVRFGMAVMILMASFLAVFGDRLIGIWIGHANFIGFPILWTLIIMLTLETHHVIHAIATMSAGYIVFTWQSAVVVVIKLALSLYLAGIYGVWGVALGTMLAQMALANWYVPYVTLKTFKIRFNDYVNDVLKKVLLFLLFMLTLNAGMRFVLAKSSDAVTMVVAFPVTAAIGFLVAFYMVCTKVERDAIIKKIYVWRIPA